MHLGHSITPPPPTTSWSAITHVPPLRVHHYAVLFSRVPQIAFPPPRVPSHPYFLHPCPPKNTPTWQQFVLYPYMSAFNTIPSNSMGAGNLYNASTRKVETMDTLLSGSNSATWTTSLSNEIGWCAQGLFKSCTKHKTTAGTSNIFLSN